MQEVKEEKSAVSVLSEFIREVKKGEENSLDISRSIVDGKEKVSVALQNRLLQPEPPIAPERMESPRRSHTFFEVPGALAYLNRYGGKNTVILADPQAGVIQIVLDETSQDGFEVLTIRPQIHPLLAPWIGIFGNPIKISSLALFLMANRSILAGGDDGREVALVFAQVRAAVKTTINHGLGKNAINGIIMEVEIQGQKSNQTIELPDRLQITCPIYLGTREESLAVDLVLEATRENEVVVLAACADLELKKIHAFEEMISLIRGNAPDYTVSMGSVEHANWQYMEKTDRTHFKERM